jgi:peroxiredoxin
MPELGLLGPDGQGASLSQVRAGRPAVLYFLRSTGCPVCVRHARGLVALAAECGLGPGVTVVLVVPGGPGEAAGLRRKVLAGEGGEGPVSAWASGAGHAAAGLGRFLAFQHSGTFVLDPAGLVRYRRTAVLPAQSFSRPELLEALASMKH